MLQPLHVPAHTSEPIALPAIDPERLAARGGPVIAAIPAHNEERFIGSVVLSAQRYVDLVLVIDDGSSDVTADVAEAAGAVVIRHERNGGKGAAVNTAF